jgi:murein DD-endopeptidase MepM/ murein hydrolase activator NlpD
VLTRGVVILLIVFGTGCDRVRRLQDALFPRPPYDAYVASLRRAGLDTTVLGREWIAAGQTAVTLPRAVMLPHRSTDVIRADEPSAVAYRLELTRGRTYSLEIEHGRVNVFADLFSADHGGAPRRVAAAGPPQRRLEFEPEENGTFTLRIQAELLAAGVVTIAQRERHALLFPVPGRGRANVHSFFGAARGGREHQGIDIFAPRGTPVVAAADGWVTSISPNALGGNVVWLWDSRRGQTLYYAHLDAHAVARGDRVKKGHVLGFVGNTGNARTTAPHLHFGIYRRGRGAIDPLHYVVDPAS